MPSPGVAIVGAACRLPGGVDTADAVADALAGVRDLLGPVPPSRSVVGDWSAVPPRGGFLADACWTRFDAARFELSPPEAMALEPRQRLLLTLASEALEDALLASASIRETSVGVYLGTGPSDWSRHALDHPPSDVYAGTGHFASVAAGRIAYLLGTTGPALSVQTACSSSLVALHLAVSDLRAGRVDRAVVGGVSALIRPEPFQVFAVMGALSPTGVCRPFDAAADGYVRGEGGGLLVLERIDDARSRGARIRGVVRGTAVGHDGRSNGLTAPSGRAQAAVVRAALADAGCGAEDVAHVEAHGTGTPLGDPIELSALARVYGDDTTVHASKARFGHLECAAGVVGVLAALATLDRGVAPAVLGLSSRNPRAPAGLRLPTTPVPLASGLVGVSSFGMSGTNAHVLIAAPPAPRARPVVADGPGLASSWQPSVPAGPRAAELALSSRLVRAHGPWRRVGDGAVRRAVRTPRLVAVGDASAASDTLAWLAHHGVEPDRVVADVAGAAEHRGRRTVWLALDGREGPDEGRWVIAGKSPAVLAELWSHGVAIDWREPYTPWARLPPRPAAGPRWPLRPGEPPPKVPLWTIAWREPGELAPGDAGASMDEWIVEDPGGPVAHRLGRLAAALDEARRGGRRLVVVTEGATALTGADPGAAAVWGWAAAAMLDTPDAFGRIVDVPRGTGDAGRQRALSVAEDRVVLGPDGPRVPRLVPGEEVDGASVDGTWVIAGGTGAIGRAVAGWLRRAGALHVVLVARTPPATVPDGCRFVAADAGDPSALAAAVADVGPIAGIVHAAGAAPRDTADAVAHAALVDSRLRIAEALDAIAPPPAPRIAITSVAGIWGARRLASYAAGSAALDAWVRARRSERSAWAAVRLGPWPDGGLVDPDELAALAGAGVLPVSSDDLDAGLAAAVSGRDACVARIDPTAFAATLRARRDAPLLDEIAPRDEPSAARVPVRSTVERLVEAHLGVVDPDVGFFDAGLDSLKAVALAEALGAALGRAVPATIAMDHPTVERLVAHLEGASVESASRPAGRGAAIAIVGLAIRLPGADDADSLRALLDGAPDALGPVPAERWDPSAHVAPRAGWVAGLDTFDPDAFGMSPRAATALDPQQRLLLELSREAIARSGLGRSWLRERRTGVFVGVGRSEYADRLRGGGDAYAWSGTGNAPAFAAGRIAHVFGLDGPVLTVDTACSSALVALHLAVRALRSGECDAALVGGANALMAPESFRYLEAIGALSPTGRCRPFDAAADGYVRAEGGGMLVLVRDPGDLDVLATVRGTAMGHDGAAAGLTVPNGPAQERVIRDALDDAGLTPDVVDAVEAHGTGTPLGDPIELGALKAVFGDRSRPLRVSAVKRWVGHLEAAAGMAGIAAAVVAFDRGAVGARVDTPNPALPGDWPVSFEGGAARVIGVSSFGMSGTNAHVVLEAASAGTPDDVRDPPTALLTASAHHADAARALLDGLAPTAAVAATVARWDAERHRAARVGERTWTGTARPVRLGFLFTGQGSQSAGMGRALVDAVPPFAEALATLASEVPDVDVRGLLLDPDRDLRDTAAAQPALVAFAVCLARVLRAWGVEPAVVLGHSVGELAAAAVAGVLSPAAAVRLAAARGRLMAATPAGGAMVAVRADPSTIIPVPGAAIAAINAPDEVVVSGPVDAVEATLAGFAGDRRSLRVSHAFHAPGMDAVVAPLAEVAASLERGAPTCAVWSPAAGGPVVDELRQPAWWGRQARATVRFAEVVSRAPVDRWVELGPRPVLTALAARNGVAAVPAVAADTPPWDALLGLLADLWTAGVPVDRAAVHPLRRPLHLAPAPLRRRRLWIDAGEQPAPRWGVRWEPVEPEADALPVTAVGESDPAAAMLAAIAAVRDGARVLTVSADPADRGAAAVRGVVATLAVERPDRDVRVVMGHGAEAAHTPVDLARLVDGRLEAPRLDRLDGPPGRVEGRWLVTGGRGAVGAEVARWLRSAGVEVHTCGRTPADAPRHHVVDVADPDAVASLFACEGPFDGVVHAAGVLADALLDRIDGPLADRVLAAKVRGAEHVGAVHDGELVLFGSATAWLGRAGQGAYAAANAALEAVVTGRRATGRPGVCLAWGPWTVGMAQGMSLEGARALSPAAALGALSRSLGGPPVQLVFDADWDVFVRRWGRPPAIIADRAARPVAVGADVAATVREEVARVLGRSELPDDVGFFDAGLDSVMAVELARRLGERLGRPLPATIAFDHPRVDLLIAALQGGRKRPDEAPRPTPGDDAIAIVGAACRLPGGVADLDGLWDLLRSGRVPVTAPPPGRFAAEALPAAARHGAFIDGIDRFDPESFGIAPREAGSIDPQQRLLLEACAGALDNAGITPPDRTGVYAGIADRGYLRRFAAEGRPFYPSPWAGTGTEASFAAGRVAHALGLGGPAVALNTTCSSSLVAVDLAVRALRDGSCDAAIAAGVHLILDGESSRYLAELGALSPSGRCHAFDARADGYVRAEGVAAVVLRRLADAERDGDPILAVLRGTATNHDGRSSGLTVPNGEAQRAVIAAAWADAGCAPTDCDLLSAHGTGTVLGDPIELRAVRAEMVDPGRTAPLFVRASKAHVGHAELAAGLVGLLDAVVCLAHGEVPALPDLQQPNPELVLDGILLAGGRRALRLAGVSAFGLSGTNAHVVLEAAPTRPPDTETGPWLMPVSAPTEEGVRALADALPPASVVVARGLARRRVHPVRAAIVGDADPVPVVAGRPRVAFLFTGQGSQHAGMGAALYGRYPVYRDALDACAAALRPWLDLHAVLGDDDALRDTRHTQPALFALGWALTALLRSWGVTPHIVAGHSVGEWTAAVVAGALDLEAACAGIAQRGALMADLPAGGAMVAVHAGVDAVTSVLGPGVEVAAENHPGETVLSGDLDAISAAAATLDVAGVRTTALRVSHAFHSARMAPMLDAWADVVAGLPWRAPTVPLVSALTGRAERDALRTAVFWRRHAREPVAWASAVRALAADGVDTWLEIGPHPVLVRAGQAVVDAGTWRCTLRRGEPADERLLQAVGALWERGVPVDLAALVPPGPRAPLPPTPLRRERHWLPGDRAALPPWTYVETWVPVARTAAPPADRLLLGDPALAGPFGARPGSAPRGEVIDARWLAVADPDALDAACAAILDAARRADRLWVVVRGAGTDPFQAALLGLVRSILVERPDLRGGVVDLAGGAPALPAAEEVRITAEGWFAPRLERLRPTDAAPPLPPTWLITGGTGRVGRAAARWLASRGVSALHLVGRRPLPDDPDDPRAVLAAEIPGVTLHAADVTDRAAVEALLGALDGPIGILHAAGVTHPQSVADADAPTIARTLSAKVRGAWWLHTLSAGMDVRAFVCTGSIAAAWGSRDLAAYAAANRFLDGLAAHRAAAGAPATTVHFGPWDGGLMDADGLAVLARMGQQPLPDGRALDLTGALLAAGVASAVVARVDWGRFAPVFEASGPRAYLDGVRPRAPDAPIAAPRPVHGPDLEATVRAAIQRRAREVLGRESVPTDAQLIDLGFDSLMATELKNALLGDGVDVPLGRLLGGPSIDELVAMTVPRMDPPALPVADGDDDDVPAWMVWSHLAAGVVGAAVAWGIGYLVLRLVGGG